jgi:excisionase family DNA binding protein
MPKPNAQVPQFMTVPEYAEHLGVCPRTVRRWIAAGKLRAHYFGRQIRVSVEDALALVAASRR